MAKLTIRYLELDLLVVDGQVERFEIKMDHPSLTADRNVIGGPLPTPAVGHRVGADRPARPRRKRKAVRR